MPNTPQQLKEKLLNSLDKNQHVVDVKTVLEVIGILEKYPISRHELETTRLGRIVNDIRKQTTDKDVAKRAKSLVRRWQELVAQPSASTAASPQISTPQSSSSTASPALPLMASAASSSKLSSPSISGTSGHTHVVNGSRNDIVNKKLGNVKPNRLNGEGSPSLPGYYNGRVNPGSHLSPSLSVPATASRIRSAESSPLLHSSDEAELKRSQTTPHGLNNSLGKLNNGYHPLRSSHPSTPELASTSARLNSGSAFTQRDAFSDTRPSDSTVNNSKSSANRSQSSVKDKTSQSGVNKKLQSSFPAKTVESIDKNNITKNKHLLSQSVQESSAHKVEQHEVFMISDDVMQSDTTDSLKLKIKRAKTHEVNTVTSHISAGKVSHTAGKNGLLNSSISDVSKTPAASGKYTPTSSNPTLSLKQSTVSSGGSHTASPALASDPSRTYTRRPDRPISKVATTSELIQKLYSGGNLRIVASETLERIATNRINRERDSSSLVVAAETKAKSAKHKSVIDDTSLPPGRLKKRARMDEEGEGTNQSALEESDVRTSGSLLNLISQLEPEPTHEEVMAATHVDPSRPATKSVSGLIKSQPAMPQNSSSSNSQTSISAPPVDPCQLLPPLDPDNIDWASLEYEAPDPSLRPPVSDTDVDRLHSDHWSFVNGQYDYRNEWHSWTQSYSMNSYDGMLHILPYVNIDE